MTSNFEKEMQRYISFSKEKKILWLNYLMFYVSIEARYFYCDDKSQNIDGKAIALSRYSEFLHRIVSFQMSVLVKQEYIIPDEVFFDCAYGTMEHLGLDVDEVVRSLRGWLPNS